MVLFVIQVLSDLTKMYFIFRADSSHDIGTGHVMRCMTLAGILKDDGHECSFVCKGHNGNINALIQKNGFHVDVLESQSPSDVEKSLDVSYLTHGSWLGSSWIFDAKATKKILISKKPDWLIVDHYALDKNWHKYVENDTKNIMVIDDLADRHHHCNILLDQNLGADIEKYRKLVPSKCKVFLGPKYALLRPEFHELREKSLLHKRDGMLRKIFINFGGGDKLNLTEKVLEALSQIDLAKNLDIDVVLGPQVELGGNLLLFKEVFREKIQFYKNINNMAELMATADLAISAGGSTSWERCYLGLPSIIFPIADNQKEIANNIAKSGAGISLTEESLINEDFKTAIETFSTPNVLLSYARSAQLLSGSAESSLIGEFYD